MIKRINIVLITMLLTMSCSLVTKVSASMTVTPATRSSPVHLAATEIVTQPVAATDTPSATPTSSVPSDAVVVNTFDQEVYPFKQDGNCSLGEAIQTVLIQQTVDGCILPAGSHTVYMPKGTYTLTQPDNAPVVLFGTKPQSGREHFDPAGFPMIANTLIILGNGSIIQRTGSNKFGIFQVFAGGGNLTLKDLTISGGDVTANDGGDDGGGAIIAAGGSLTLDHVTLTHNLGNEGGALDTIGDVTVTDSTILQNTSTGDGGGVYNMGHLRIKNSVISANVAGNLDNGGGINNNFNGQLTLDDSQIVGNIANTGGGVYNDSGIVNITDQSVISGNVATYKGNGGPVDGGGGIDSRSNDNQLTVKNSFIVGNWASDSYGGGIIAGGQSATITDSVLSGNIAGSGSAVDYVDGQAAIKGNCILDNQFLWPKGSSGIENDSLDSKLDASQNWWGTKGPSILGNVDIAPQLTNPPTICAGTIPTPYPTPSGK